MKKIILWCIIFIALLITIFYQSITDWYHFSEWKKLYNETAFTGAIEHFIRLSDKYTAFHNIGNSWYELWKKNTTSKDKMYLTQSLGAYSGALELQENADTRYNYKLVENLLNEDNKQQQKDEKQEQEQEQSKADKQDSEGENEEQGKPTGTGSQDKEDESKEQGTQEKETEQKKWEIDKQQSDSWDKEKTWEEKSQEEWQEWELSEQWQEKGTKWSQWVSSQERGEQYQLENEDNVGELSEQDKKKLEQYIESLKYQQQQNQQFYGKRDDIKGEDIFDSFFNRNTGWEENDW